MAPHSYRPPQLSMGNRAQQRVERIQKRYYRSLFGLLALSVLLFLLQLAEHGHTIWQIYYAVYIVLALSHTWFLFVLLFWGDAKPRARKRYEGEKISVIIPCYNENPALLEKAIRSVVAARGNKEIIVVDDGSTDLTHQVLTRIAAKHGIILHFFNRNKGKRRAIYYALKHLIGESEFVVTMDSDTVLDREALVRLARSLKEKNVGAASGDVRLLNEKENLLTRMIGGYYWSALHVHRKAESAIGMVSCCSGALAAFKTSVLRGVIEEFVKQEFFGSRCTHSEDRHLTNLMHKRNYKVVFVPDAISYTKTPSRFDAFLKQQQRWRRGFIQEALFTLTFAWKNKPLFFFQTLVWELALEFLSFGVLFVVLLTLLSDPGYFVTTILPSLLVVSAVKNLPAFFVARGKLFGLLLFTLFSVFIAHFQGAYALFTVKNKSWITR